MHHTPSVLPILVPPWESSSSANQTLGTSSSQVGVGEDDQDSQIEIELDRDG